MSKRYFYIILYLLSPIIPVILIYLSDINKYSDIMIFIPPALGAIAYSWIMGQFVMASRPNLIMKYFWDDEYYHFHKVMGISTLIISLLHGLFEIRLGRIYFLISKIGYILIILFALFVVMALILMVDENLLKGNIIKNFRKTLENHRIFKYQNMVAVHSILALVAFVLLYHILISRACYSVKLVYGIYFTVPIMLYVIFKIKKVLNRVRCE